MPVARPSLPLAVSVVSLVVALSSSATAALAISGKDIKPGTVTGKQVKNGSLRLNDLAAGVRTQVRAAGTPGQTGPVGPEGPEGPEGPVGPAGGLSGYEFVTSSAPYGSGAHATQSVACPVGKVAVGGGGSWLGTAAAILVDADTYLHESVPVQATRAVDGQVTGTLTPTNPATQVTDAWRVTGWNGSGSSKTLRVYVLCATV